ncbi:rho guanine nucleotide exchange factor 2 [Cylas formicarius]|uniref:rho guanine nucleotide exchange factor 2 n=1 Tax=Cylas formicarius TaxID=197179 RepID=UPI002958C7CB|nr:rho guanine nucleotide exchange factor 2 [Cylas formicarius]
MEKQTETEMLIPVSSDECGASGGESDSDEDVVTDYQLLDVQTTRDDLPLIDNVTSGSGERGGSHALPTISLTSYSPTTAMRTYAVLEDSLQQVHELRESVQLMRNTSATTRDFTVFALNASASLTQSSRFSASCPALNDAAGHDSDTFVGSLGSSPLTHSLSRKESRAQDWAPADVQRRKSWPGFEDISTLIKLKQKRQRSVSLGSMESIADDPSLVDTIDGSAARLTDRHRSRGGGNTRSLNETDLHDFAKVKLKRDSEQLHLLAQRPLQKSVSTPSIIPFGDLALKPSGDDVQPILQIGRPSSMERGIEDGRRSSHTDYEIRIKEHLQNVTYDPHPEKLRKRGSLFFRKKKEKTKKFPHQWVSASYGTSHVCDVCNKALSSKPALYCEPCGTTVHQNACKDTISECVNVKIKNAKSMAKLASFTVPLTSAKHHQASKRGSGFAVNACDDKDGDQQHDGANFADDVALVQFEFLSGTTVTAADLCPDLSLGFYDNEPDSWTTHVGKEIARKLKQKEVKRQEHIYEFILTEKHHCMTLLVMQKIFVDGLQKYFNLGPNLERMFPRLSDLTDLHLGFLSKLRQRQRESAVVSSIADILLEEFSDLNAVRLKSAYGEFCSRHRDAVDTYRECIQSDAQFGEFVKHCQTNPLLKKKGIPECILFVTQRLTKYPLLIEPLIKTCKENQQELDVLQKALRLVKEILVEVDAQVAQKEREDRKLEIYHRIDSKSYTFHKGYKFKKSDILQGNRSLRFEGIAMLMQGRGKMQLVSVIIMSDVLFFLQENSQKYVFFTPDNNKAGVFSLQKLLVREKAGQDSRSIYLISSNPTDPEMFELKVHKPKDKQTWIHAIREAVQHCPDTDDNASISLEDKQNQMRSLVALLRQNDIEQALLLEEKMALQLKLLAASGLDPPSPPSYRHLVNEQADTGQMWKEVLTAVQEVNKLVSSLYATGTNLSRSVSSAGERHSDAYVSPILPKRAETFSGFDNNAPPLKLLGKKTLDTKGLKPGDIKHLLEKLPFRNYEISGGRLLSGAGAPIAEQQDVDSAHLHPATQQTNETPALLYLGREQQYAAIQVSHYVYTLLCIISQLMTTNGNLQGQITSLKSGTDGVKQYRHNQQLEELRNLQDKLSDEKASWAALRERELRELEEKRQELAKLQEQVRAEQKDITHQREQLYRKMEMLTNQGLLISPNVAIPIVNQVDESPRDSSKEGSPQFSDTPSNMSTASSSLSHSASVVADKRKESKWGKGVAQPKQQLPLNLISTKNQQKVSQQLPIKQQIPLKLATRLSSGVGGDGSRSHPNSPQQILPMKLSQDEASEGGRNPMRP